MRLQLRQVEDVPDEPLEPHGLVGDHVERRGANLRVLCEPLPQRLDVPANRGQRRAQLVGDRHQEVALLLLRLGESCGHLAEALGEVSDLAAARNVRYVDVVVAA